MTDIASKLQKELQDVARPYLKQIQELKSAAQNKSQALTELTQETEAREQEVESLRAEAQATLGRGGDPRPLLAKASSLKGELEDLQSFISEAGQPDKEEQDQIQELKQQMASEIHKQIEQTKAFQRQSQIMVDSMRSAVQALDDWRSGLEKFCSDLGIDSRKHWLVDLSDSSEGFQLGRRLGAYTQRHAHVFNRR